MDQHWSRYSCPIKASSRGVIVADVDLSVLGLTIAGKGECVDVDLGCEPPANGTLSL
jgi:hypothetical protein